MSNTVYTVHIISAPLTSINYKHSLLQKTLYLLYITKFTTPWLIALIWILNNIIDELMLHVANILLNIAGSFVSWEEAENARTLIDNPVYNGKLITLQSSADNDNWN